MKRALVYVRVSTSKQSHEMQLRELREHADRNGWDSPVPYVEVGSGGKRLPVRDRLVRDACDALEGVDVVAVWSVTRFGRSAVEAMEAVDRLVKAGVLFYTCKEGMFDASSPMGKFGLTVLSACAELERAWIVERVQAGVEKCMETGKTRTGRWFGRPKRDGGEAAPQLRTAPRPSSSSLARAGVGPARSRGDRFPLRCTVGLVTHGVDCFRLGDEARADFYCGDSIGGFEVWIQVTADEVDCPGCLEHGPA